jgi:thiol-disulfide isomerase/thioredoxin
MFGRTIAATLLASVVVSASALAAAPAAGADVPDEILTKMDSLSAFPGRPQSEEEYKALLPKFAGQLTESFAMGLAAEGKYPAAENLLGVRMRMLRAASFLDEYGKTAGARQQLVGIAGRIISSSAPVEAKVTAEYFVVRDQIKPQGKPVAKDAEKRIRAFLLRYNDLKIRYLSLIRGVDLARDADLEALRTELLDALQKDHLESPGIQEFLLRNGRHPLFSAKLKRLDGTALNLPGDMKGKVLVIDFWATWCGPCMQEVPHMKEVYAKYKPRGVEFIGISLDKPDMTAAKLAAFVKSNEMSWVHTYSGQGWDDPTVRQYGIRGIPSVWVIGKDGRTVTDNGRANLEATLEQALKGGAVK